MSSSMCLMCKTHPRDAFPLTPCLWDNSEGRLVDLDLPVSSTYQNCFGKVCQVCKRELIAPDQDVDMPMDPSLEDLEAHSDRLPADWVAKEWVQKILSGKPKKRTVQLLVSQQKSANNDLEAQPAAQNSPTSLRSEDCQNSCNKRPRIFSPTSPLNQSIQSVSSAGSSVLFSSHSAQASLPPPISLITDPDPIIPFLDDRSVFDDYQALGELINSDSESVNNDSKVNLEPQNPPNSSESESPLNQSIQSVSSASSVLTSSHSAQASLPSPISLITDPHSIIPMPSEEAKEKEKKELPIPFLAERSVFDYCQELSECINCRNYDLLYETVETKMSENKYSTARKSDQTLFILKSLMQGYSLWRDIQAANTLMTFFTHEAGKEMIINLSDYPTDEEKSQILHFLYMLEAPLSSISQNYRPQTENQKEQVQNLQKMIEKIRDTRGKLVSATQRITASEWISLKLVNGNRSLRTTTGIQTKNKSLSAERVMFLILTDPRNTSVLPSEHFLWLRAYGIHIADCQKDRKGDEKIVEEFSDLLIAKELEIRARIRIYRRLRRLEISDDLSEGQDEAAVAKLKDLMTL